MPTKPVIKKSIHDCKHPGCNGVLINDWGEIRCLICNREHDENGELVKLIDPLAEDINCHEVPHATGGRPKLQTLDEIRQRHSLEAGNNNNGGRLPNDIKKLKEMWRQRNMNVGGV